LCVTRSSSETFSIRLHAPSAHPKHENRVRLAWHRRPTPGDAGSQGVERTVGDQRAWRIDPHSGVSYCDRDISDQPEISRERRRSRQVTATRSPTLKSGFGSLLAREECTAHEPHSSRARASRMLIRPFKDWIYFWDAASRTAMISLRLSFFDDGIRYGQGWILSPCHEAVTERLLRSNGRKIISIRATGGGKRMRSGGVIEWRLNSVGSPRELLETTRGSSEIRRRSQVVFRAQQHLTVW